MNCEKNKDDIISSSYYVVFITDLLHVTSHGETMEHKGAIMGLFRLVIGELHNNKPVWIQDSQTNILFYTKYMS